MLETDACDISQSGIIKGLVWMTACATFAQLLKHRESDVKWIHPGAIIQWWWYFAIRVPFIEKTSSPASEMTHGSWHISLVFKTHATVSSPAVQLLVWQQKVCKYVKQAYVNLCKWPRGLGDIFGDILQLLLFANNFQCSKFCSLPWNFLPLNWIFILMSTCILRGGSLNSIPTKEHLNKCYQTGSLWSEDLNI